MARRRGRGGLADYTVAAGEGDAMLDAPHRLRATPAGDLAIRWNCKAGKCGSCCTEACPAGIKINDNAIIPMKERSADQRYDPLGRPMRSWRRREGRPPQAEKTRLN